MKKVDLVTPASRIRYALETLETHWQRAGQEWDDTVSKRFAERELEPLLPKLKIALDAINRMHNLLTEVQRDCEE